MPTDYDLKVGEKKYTLHWTGAKPPTDADLTAAYSQLSKPETPQPRQKVHSARGAQYLRNAQQEVATDPLLEKRRRTKLLDTHGNDIPLLDPVIDKVLGEGTADALNKMKGFKPGLAQGLKSFTAPTSIVLGAASGGLGKLAPVALAGFGAQALKGAVERAHEGDIGGALGGLTAFLMPLAAHGAGKAMEATEGARSLLKKPINFEGMHEQPPKLKVRTTGATGEPAKKPTVRVTAATNKPPQSPLRPADVTETRPAPKHGKTPVETPATPPVRAETGEHPLQQHIDAVMGKRESGFAHAGDTYRQWLQGRRSTPALRAQFAQHLFDLVRTGKYELATPSGNVHERDVFTAKMADGKPVRIYGLIEKKGKSTLAVDAQDGVKPEGDTKPAQTPKPAAKPQEPLTGTKSATVEEEREQRGLSAVDRQGYTAMGQAYQEGKAAVESKEIDPVSLAHSVAETPRPLTAREVGALGYDRARIIHAHRDASQELSDAIDKGDETNIALWKLSQARLESELETNDQALVKGGREQSAAFNARKMMINDDYSLAAVKLRAKVKKGSALTDAEDAKLTELTAKYEASERKVKEQSERIDKLESDQAVRRMKLRQRQETRAMTRAELDTELDVLMKEFVKAGSKASAGLDPKLVTTVGKIAYNRLRAGTNTVEGLVDEVHNLLKDHIEGLSTRDVRDAISGYGREPRTTGDDARKQMRELQKQARILSAIEDAEAGEQPATGRKPGPASEKVKKLRAQLDASMKASGLKPERRNDPLPAIKKNLTAQIAELDRRLKEGDFDFPKRKPTAYDEEANKLRADRDAKKLEVDRAIEAAKKPSWQDHLVRWQRASILSGMTTLGRLSAAVTTRAVTTPVEEGVGGVVGKVLPRLADQSPRHGGVNIRAEAAAARQFMEKATLQDMWQKLKTGANSLDVQYGRKDVLPGKGVLAFFGNLHGALKTPAQRAEFFRSYEKRAAFELRHGKELTPDVQAAVAASAYADSKRVILQGDNMAVDIYNEFVGAVSRKSETAGAVVRMAVPIVRVPTNFVAEVGEHVAGGPIALAKIIKAKGIEKLSADESDTVMRLFKKQGLGAGLIALGYFGGKSMKAGGVYVPGRKPKPGESEPGTLQVFGVTIPAWAMHSAAGATLQLGATARMAVDETQGGRIAKAEEAVSNTARGALNEVPFIEEIERLGDFMRGGPTAGKFLGETAGGILIPQLAQQGAKALDPAKRRVPRGFTDTLKEKIPGLREQVPSERQQSGKGPRPARAIGGH